MGAERREGVKKIPTLFKRDPDDMRRLLPEVHPDCQWVLDGEGAATRKYDGTCVMYDPDSLDWWARREVKPAKQPPANYRPIETDPATGKTVGWEPIEQSAFWKAFKQCAAVTDTDGMAPGMYELCGPKVNGNPEGFDHHVLVRHATAELLTVDGRPVPTDFEALREYMQAFPHEGIVWHHPDGRMAKLKRRDFADRSERRAATA
jgi:hypothetical protein